MAEQPVVPPEVTPAMFFEQLMPAGFQAQVEQGLPAPKDYVIQYRLTGEGGGEWNVSIRDGRMTVTPGSGDSHMTITLSMSDWLDAVLGRNGADLSLLLPQARPGRPDGSEAAKRLRGTMALELARDDEPYRMEISFNNADSPRTTVKSKISDYVAIQQGKLNGQEAFMTGRVRVEGDLGFLMQVVAITG
ncbi:MAG TPA: SCP2 sterol-binding domain-containing protein [Candidatus Limnocylindria bacterium]|nr:SCP2 sterol-binding domain-containing protein [Candidatus Limnocylindria bacterium]